MSTAEEQARVDAVMESLLPTAREKKQVNSKNNRDLNKMNAVLRGYRKRNPGAQIVCVVKSKDVDCFLGDIAGDPAFRMAVYKMLYKSTFAERWPVIGESVLSASDISSAQAVLSYGVQEGYLARVSVVNLLAALAGGERRVMRGQTTAAEGWCTAVTLWRYCT
jgi:hypothetical protein